MAKSTVTYSLDIEAAGPIPGPWWMCSFGLCRTDDPSAGFKRELRPLRIPGLARPESPEALAVVAKGLPAGLWSPGASGDANVRRVCEYFEIRGEDPARALRDAKEWLLADAAGGRAVLVGSPATFDFMWLYWYWWHLLEEMPPFGFSGLDVRSYFMGMHGVDFLGTGKARYLKHYPNEHSHTHDPLEDARQQGAIWRDMVAARRAQKEAEKRAAKADGKKPGAGI